MLLAGTFGAQGEVGERMWDHSKRFYRDYWRDPLPPLYL